MNNIKLKFSCGENWDDMYPVENSGRHCDQCHKIVYDFTNSKAGEFRKILAENNYNVCGRFTAKQTTVPQQIFPFWKRWASAAVVLIGFNVFGSSAIAQKQKSPQPLKITKSPIINQSDYVTGIVDGPAPEFIGGTKALSNFLSGTIRYIKGTPNGKVIASFVISKSGKLTDIKIIHGLTPAADNEVIRVLKLSPKWKPGKLNNRPVAVQFNLPVSFSEK